MCKHGMLWSRLHAVCTECMMLCLPCGLFVDMTRLQASKRRQDTGDLALQAVSTSCHTLFTAMCVCVQELLNVCWRLALWQHGRLCSSMSVVLCGHISAWHLRCCCGDFSLSWRRTAWDKARGCGCKQKGCCACHCCFILPTCRATLALLTACHVVGLANRLRPESCDYNSVEYRLGHPLEQAP